MRLVDADVVLVEHRHDDLEEAVAACRDALKEYTRERVLDWTMTQNNLGNALATLGERTHDRAKLVEARKAAFEIIIQAGQLFRGSSAGNRRPTRGAVSITIY